jgi:short-subunit dehydrogenase
MSKRDFEGKYVLVTGAGSGIGRETAVAFAARGAKLELVDLSEAGLIQTADRCRALGAMVESHIADVSDADVMGALAANIHARIPALDVLVNNAGMGAAGGFLDTTLATWRKTMDVNLMGVVHGCHVFLPAMVKRGKRASVVNVASVAGLVAMSDMPVYSTSKFAVVGFSESLRSDMLQHDIHVSCICPGVVDTAIIKNTRYEGDKFASDQTRDNIQKFYKRRSYSPSKVAAVIVRAVEQGAGLVPVTPESWLLWYSQRVAPGLVSWLSGKGGDRLILNR